VNFRDSSSSFSSLKIPGFLGKKREIRKKMVMERRNGGRGGGDSVLFHELSRQLEVESRPAVIIFQL